MDGEVLNLATLRRVWDDLRVTRERIRKAREEGLLIVCSRADRDVLEEGVRELRAEGFKLRVSPSDLVDQGQCYVMGDPDVHQPMWEPRGVIRPELSTGW